MTLIGICFVCGRYFDGGVVVKPDDDVDASTVFGRFYCHTHAPKPCFDCGRRTDDLVFRVLGEHEVGDGTFVCGDRTGCRQRLAAR